jgi:hypothetical protein
VSAADNESHRSRRRSARAIVVDCLLLGFISFVIALGVVLGTAFLHGDRVSSGSDLKHLHYGFPVSWVSQDQSALVESPVTPVSIGMTGPWQNPTSFRLEDFLLDIAIIGAAPFGLYWVTVGIGASRRPRPRRLTSATA